MRYWAGAARRILGAFLLAIACAIAGSGAVAPALADERCDWVYDYDDTHHACDRPGNSLPPAVRAGPGAATAAHAATEEILVRSAYLLAARGGNIPGRDALTATQAENLKRFERSVPSAGGPATIRELPNGGRAFQADVPARDIPGSFATYEKQVDAFGETLSFTKTSYAPDGSIVHVKDKISGLTITPPG